MGFYISNIKNLYFTFLDMGPASMDVPSPPSSPNSTSLKNNDGPASVFDIVPGTSAEDLDFDASQLPSTSRLAKDLSSLTSDIPVPSPSSDIFDTTLMNAEDPGFPLAPYKKSLSQGTPSFLHPNSQCYAYSNYFCPAA